MKTAVRSLSRYELPCPTVKAPIRILLLADLHGDVREEELPRWKAEKPDLILLSGDTLSGNETAEQQAAIRTYLRGLAEIAPLYASLGNHEAQYHVKRRFVPPPAEKPAPLKPRAIACVRFLEDCGATVLPDSAVTVLLGETVLCIGGLSSALRLCPGVPAPDPRADFSLLLCHHPEYFDTYIAPTRWQLMLSGHAHGGQWRTGNRGVFAPGQGLFPKYTGGFYANGRLLVSRGMASHGIVPRIFNKPEALLLTVSPLRPGLRKE